MNQNISKKILAGAYMVIGFAGSVGAATIAHEGTKNLKLPFRSGILTEAARSFFMTYCAAAVAFPCYYMAANLLREKKTGDDTIREILMKTNSIGTTGAYADVQDLFKKTESCEDPTDDQDKTVQDVYDEMQEDQ